jgi:hypothetical protein
MEMSMAIEAQYTWVAKRNTISMDCSMELLRLELHVKKLSSFETC